MPTLTAADSPVVAVADDYLGEMTVAVFALIKQVRRAVLTKADSGFAQVFGRVVVAGAEAEPSFRGRLDLINEQAVDIARQRAADLIQDLEETARITMQQVFGDALSARLTTAQTNAAVRDLIGLDARSAGAVMNFRAGLEGMLDGTGPAVALPSLVDGRFSLTGLTAEKVDALADGYSDRLLAHRADVIARTETLRAANAGQRALWEDAADRGLIDRDKARRVWVSTEDGRECPECAALDGMEFTFDDAEEPPAHPNCRCTMSLDSGEDIDEGVGTGEPLPEMSDDAREILDMTGRPTQTSETFDAAADRRAAMKALRSDDRNLADALQSFTGKRGGVARLRGEIDDLLSGRVTTGPGADRARAILGAIDSYGASPKLYRGMWVEGERDALLDRFGVGGQFDLNVSSFTADRNVGLTFADRKTNVPASATGDPVFFRVAAGDMNGLPVSRVSAFGNEAEWVGGGRFEVVNVQVQTVQPPGRPKMRAIVVDIKQVVGLGR